MYSVFVLREGSRPARTSTMLLSPGYVRNGTFRIDARHNTVTADFGREEPVRILSSRIPTYPRELKQACVTGTVIVSFIVDTTGRFSPGSLAVRSSDDYRFTRAVRDVVDSARFEPAKIAGVKVRQLVQQPFDFRVVPSKLCAGQTFPPPNERCC
jgi:TonB family protein